MSDMELLIILVSMWFITSAFTIVRLLDNKFAAWSAVFVSMAFAFAGYQYWGAWDARHTYLRRLEQNHISQSLVKQFRTPEKLARKLKATLDDSKESARGWYLLGRLYTGAGDWKDAEAAFAKAYKWDHDVNVVINYAQSIWRKTPKEPFPRDVHQELERLSKQYPDNTDVLSLLALDYYTGGKKSAAIVIWQRLLKTIPPESRDAEIIRSAIMHASKG